MDIVVNLDDWKFFSHAKFRDSLKIGATFLFQSNSSHRKWGKKSSPPNIPQSFVVILIHLHLIKTFLMHLMRELKKNTNPLLRFHCLKVGKFYRLIFFSSP